MENRRKWNIVCAFAASLVLGVLTIGSAQEKTTPQESLAVELQRRGLSNKLLQRGTRPAQAGWPKDSATGAKVTRQYGAQAGLTRDKLPGARFSKLEEIKRMAISKEATGLYLVDVDFVPRDVLDALKAYRFTLKEDGTLLDANNEPVLALVTSEVYLIQRGGAGSDNASQGASARGLLGRLTEALVPTVQAASPFPWRCYSFTPWAVYHSGFHRWYDARTWAGAYGADSGGGCSGGSPYTHIDYIQTRAAVGGGGNENHCFNCESEYSRDVWDVGYFWPAHGTPVTTHVGVWADGSFSFSRASHLTW